LGTERAAVKTDEFLFLLLFLLKHKRFIQREFEYCVEWSANGFWFSAGVCGLSGVRNG